MPIYGYICNKCGHGFQTLVYSATRRRVRYAVAKISLSRFPLSLRQQKGRVMRRHAMALALAVAACLVLPCAIRCVEV